MTSPKLLLLIPLVELNTASCIENMSLRARGEKTIYNRKHSKEWNPKREKIESAEKTKHWLRPKKKERKKERGAEF